MLAWAMWRSELLPGWWWACCCELAGCRALWRASSRHWRTALWAALLLGLPDLHAKEDVSALEGQSHNSNMKK